MREEGEAEMTDAFIAKVLSVIYNYAIDDYYCRNTMVRFVNQEAEKNLRRKRDFPLSQINA